MLRGVRERVVACGDCGASTGGDRPWCGACGGRVATRHPTSSPDDDEQDREAVDRSRSRRWWILGGVAVAVVVLVAAAATATGGGDADALATTTGVTLLGRADDGTNRSSTADPARDLVRLWSSATDDWWWGADLPLAAVDEDTLLAGDRLLSIEDGSLLGGSTRAIAILWGAVSPDGVTGVADGDVLRLVEAATGDEVGSVPLPGTATDSWFVTGWFDDLVLLTRFEDDVGSGTAVDAEAVAIEAATGRVRWRVPGEIGQLVGDGWFLSWTVGEGGGVGPVLTDGRTGERSSQVTLDSDVLAADPVVADGVVFVPERDRLVASELRTGERLWSRDVAGDDTRVLVVGDELQLLSGGFDDDAMVTWLERSTGAVTHERRLPIASGAASGSFLSTPVDQVDGLVVAASDDGVQVRRRDGDDWEVAMPDVIATGAIDHGRGLVAVVTGTAQQASGGGGWTLLGDATLHVYDDDGRERFSVPVGTGSFAPPVRFAAGLDGRLLMARGTSFPVVAQASGVELATGRRTDAGALLDPWTGGHPAASATTVAGVLPGGPGSGGPVPLLWHAGDGGLAVRDALLSLSLSVPGPLSAVPPVALDGRLAVATATGTAVVTLPAPGEARPVDDVVAFAVGVDRTDGGASRRHDAVVRVEVDGVVPVAAVDDLLLVVDGVAPGAARGRVAGRLAAVDPRSGDRSWTSDVLVDAWDLTGEFPWIDGEGVRQATTVLHDDGSPIVVVDERRVVAVDRRTGAVVWSHDHAHPIGVGGVLLGDAVVVGTSLDVRALDVATGEQRWRHVPDDLVTAIGGGGTTTLVGTAGGIALGLDAAGRPVDRWVGAPVRVDDVVVIEGMVVLSHADGSTTGFGPSPTDVAGGDVVELSGDP